MTVAPAGIAISDAGPAATILSPSMSDGGVMDRRNVVAGDEHAADERERFRIAGLRAHDRRNDGKRGEGRWHRHLEHGP